MSVARAGKRLADLAPIGLRLALPLCIYSALIGNSLGAGEAKPLPPKQENGDLVTVRGQVLKPNGQPAVGAKVFALSKYWTLHGWRHLFATAIAGPVGQFELPIVVPTELHGRAGDWFWIAARADGFGMQWIQLGGRRRNEAGTKPVLKLVPESPVHGRVVDWTGKPMPGVRVKVLELSTAQDGDDLGRWLKGLRSGERKALYRQPDLILTTNDDVPQPPLVTDQEGRFVLRGIGPERIARVELRGETMAYAQFDVVTRKMEPISCEYEPGQTGQVFGAEFTYQASRPGQSSGPYATQRLGSP